MLKLWKSLDVGAESIQEQEDRAVKGHSRLDTATVVTNLQRLSMCALGAHKTSPLNNKLRKREDHGAQTFTSEPLVIHRIWERELLTSVKYQPGSSQYTINQAHDYTDGSS